MGISLKKFALLKPESRAKKLSDLALRVVRSRTTEERKRALANYARLCEWMKEPERALDSVRGDLLGREDLHRLSEVYVRWRRDAGFGPEESFFRAVRAHVLETATSWGRASNFGTATLSDLLARAQTDGRPERHGPEAEVLLHSLRSAYNVGSVLRTSDCFGVSRVHISGYTPGTDHAGVASAAMGCEAYVPLRRWESWQECLADFRQKGPGKVVAIETGADSTRLGETIWPKRVLFVVGNEELGIQAEILKECDQRVTIPMLGRKSSLNVSNAFAVVAYDIRRPRHDQER